MTDNITADIVDLAVQGHKCDAGTTQINISTRCPCNYAIVNRQNGKVLVRTGWGKEVYSEYGIESKRDLIKILKRSIKLQKRQNRYTKTKEN